MELKKVYKQGEDEKASRTLPQLWNNAIPLSGLQRNALASLVHFCYLHNKANQGRKCPVLEAREGDGIVSVVGVGFLRLSHPRPCLYTFFSSIPTPNEVFSETFYLLVNTSQDIHIGVGTGGWWVGGTGGTCPLVLWKGTGEHVPSLGGAPNHHALLYENLAEVCISYLALIKCTLN